MTTANKYADLHLHTNFSDGVLSPEQVVEKAGDLGFAAIAITDHDVLGGIEPAISAGEEYGVEIIPGVELSAEAGGEEVHILGFYIDWRDQQFHQKLQEFSGSRLTRAMRMVDKLNQLGLDMTHNDVLKQVANPDFVGRPHVAAALLEKGHVNSTQEAFDEYLAEGKPAYAPKQELSPANAVAMILEAGGIPVLAHPGILSLTLQQDIIPPLTSSGLMGLEAFYPLHTDQQSAHYCNLAKRHNLLITGGSDFHGRGRMVMGSVKLPYKHIDALKKTNQSKKSVGLPPTHATSK